MAIAAAILSGILAAVYSTSAVAFRLAISSRQHSEATVSVQEQFEQLQAMRDGYIPQGATGWNTFRAGIFGSTISTPRCTDVVPYTVHLTSTKNNLAHTVTWSVQSGNGTVATDQATYTIAVDACYIDSSTTDRIKFTARTDWEGPGGAMQHNDAIFELTNVNDIKPLGYFEPFSASTAFSASKVVWVKKEGRV